jgi:O-antigen/teichoic acid export membrane protein
MTSEREQYDRNESVAHRLDRNFSELLQELRVAQTGVQILFAFLLSIAFQQRFKDITEFQRDVYLATLISTSLAGVLFIGPVAMHRAMFRRHLKDELVFYTSRMAAGGLVFLALSILGAMLLIVDVVVGSVVAAAVVAALAFTFGYFWLAVPLLWRRRAPADAPPPDEAGIVP